MIQAWIGRLDDVRAPGVFLRAAAAAARRVEQGVGGGGSGGGVELKVLVLGDGALMPALRRLASSLGVVAEFMGWVPPERVLSTLLTEVTLRHSRNSLK